MYARAVSATRWHCHDTAAGINHRALCREQKADGLADLTGVAARCRRIRAQLHFFGQLILELVEGIGDVLRQIDDNRTRTTARCRTERLPDRLRNLFGAFSAKAAFY